jgi:hypothetical protein
MAKSKRKKPTTMTVDEVAAHLIANLKPEKREQLTNSTLSAWAYHRSLGMYIRNHYIYSKKYKIDWSTAKGVGHPDDMSNAIMKRVLEMLR